METNKQTNTSTITKSIINYRCQEYHRGLNKIELKKVKTQIDSSTIDGNVELVHSQYSCILTSQVLTQFVCPTKLLKIVIILELSAYFTVK